MLEVAAVREAANPHETLLVADAMTGQDAVNVAKAFGERAGITGIVLTRVDGDARGGAALSMRGDHRQADRADGHRREDRRARSLPCRADRRAHPRHGRRRQPGREGGRDDRPGGGRKARRQDEKGRVRPRRSRRSAAPDPPDGRDGRHARRCCRASARSRSSSTRPISTRRIIKRQEAIISSMTKAERRNPKLLNGSRRRRIAVGLGHHGAGDQPAPEAVSGHGRDDEKDEEAGPARVWPGMGSPGCTAGGGLSALAEGSGHVVEDPPGARRRQKAPLLQHRRRGFAQPARRPLHREARHLQPDARPLACRSGDPQNRAHPALARGRRPADRSRRPVSRRCRADREARRSARRRSSRGRRRAPRNAAEGRCRSGREAPRPGGS